MKHLPIIIGVVVFAYLIVQFLPLLRARRVVGQPTPDLRELDPGLDVEHGTLLLYFWSARCPMCSPVTRVVDELAETHDNVIKIDVAAHPELARRFGIMGTPTLIRTHQGRIERMLVGAKPPDQIRALLQQDASA
ncbi:MAG: thioredoxin family protein [Chromatiales bacterium]|jgi:thioredoxin 1